MAKGAQKLQIIPLGGLGEIGKNMTVIRVDDEILVIDSGLMFPDEDMLGIDLVIPDISYLIENKDKIKAIVLTHGHEDHIGALPYVLKKINVPVYGTRLTLGILEGRLKENGVDSSNLHSVMQGDIINVGCFSVGFIRVNHSIPDAVGLSIKTPVGMIVHTGDFKLDYTPIDGKMTDFRRFSDLGNRGVLVLMADSTNSEREGHTPSERTVGAAFDRAFHNARGRIIVATFSSNVHRIQQVIDTAVRYKRHVAVLGRSMVNVVNISLELGYITAPEGTIVDIDEIHNYRMEQMVIITTGSQGEPMSALSRIASGEHKSVKLKKGDMVILSSTPVPGNEKTVSNVVNKLFEKGAEVIYSDIADIHVSGHACQEELKLIHSLIKPKFFMPVHGEYRHLIAHARLAESLGMNKDNIFVLENGDILKVNKRRAKRETAMVEADAILVDGLGVGDVGNIVLRDRKLLSESGLIIVVAAIEKESHMVVSGPEIISRGFVYVRENESLIEEARKVAMEALEKCQNKRMKDWNAMKSQVRDALNSYIYETTKRSPIILPIFLEV